jgi:hypothetical protein
LQESRHTEVMARWGRVWLCQSAVVFVLSLALAITRWLRLSQFWPEALVVVVAGTAAALPVWFYRVCGGVPLTGLERQLLRIWGIVAAGMLLGVLIELRGEPAVEWLIPVTLLTVGIGLGCTAVLLGGSFYPLTLCCAVSAVVMAAKPDLSPVIGGTVFALGLLVPGWRYSRLQPDKKTHTTWT